MILPFKNFIAENYHSETHVIWLSNEEVLVRMTPTQYQCLSDCIECDIYSKYTDEETADQLGEALASFEAVDGSQMSGNDWHYEAQPISGMVLYKTTVDFFDVILEQLKLNLESSMNDAGIKAELMDVYDNILLITPNGIEHLDPLDS